MAKIILNESQYNKLKYVLLESENIGNLTVDIDNQTVKFNEESILGIGTKKASVLNAIKGTVFKRGIDNVLRSTNQTVKYYEDPLIQFETTIKGQNISYGCVKKQISLSSLDKTFMAAGDTKVAFDKLCTSKKEIADKYMRLLQNKLIENGISAKLDPSGDFLYWGPWVIYKDVLRNNGFPIQYKNNTGGWDYFKFKDFNNKYAGQPNLNSVLIQKKGNNTPLPLLDTVKKEHRELIFCKNADPTKYWSVFKGQVNQFLNGCTYPTDGQISCKSPKFDFYNYKTPSYKEWAQTENNKWFAYECYAGEPFTNLIGYDLNGVEMTLAQFINNNKSSKQVKPKVETQPTNKPSTPKSTTKPAPKPATKPQEKVRSGSSSYEPPDISDF